MERISAPNIVAKNWKIKCTGHSKLSRLGKTEGTVSLSYRNPGKYTLHSTLLSWSDIEELTRRTK